MHLDFNNPNWSSSIGTDYDPHALVQTWKNAGVEAVTLVFGLCACGNSYLSFSGPFHPGLETDMLDGLMSIALAAEIAVFVQFSAGINDRLVIEHPVNRLGLSVAWKRSL